MDDKQKTAFSGLVAAGSAGVQVAAVIAVGGFIGKKIDDYLGMSPWVMAGGIAVGFVAGLWTMYRSIR